MADPSAVARDRQLYSAAHFSPSADVGSPAHFSPSPALPSLRASFVPPPRGFTMVSYNVLTLRKSGYEQTLEQQLIDSNITIAALQETKIPQQCQPQGLHCLKIFAGQPTKGGLAIWIRRPFRLQNAAIYSDRIQAVGYAEPSYVMTFGTQNLHPPETVVEMPRDDSAYPVVYLINLEDKAGQPAQETLLQAAREQSRCIEASQSVYALNYSNGDPVHFLAYRFDAEPC
ncbi:MAG: hypothetical protein AAF709_24405 [Pseudomonadota bacterium]